MIEYLFIRSLEACNAGCEMCGFAFSGDSHRLGMEDFRSILARAKEEGVRYVRFTGGEPLLHGEIVRMVELITAQGLRSSIITNGALLPKKLDVLARAGLSQVIVSIDGSLAETHDRIRRLPGLFALAVQGLRLARERGLWCRVNTVCGPDNFREMPALQEILTTIGVRQWELSSLKLERVLDYRPEDRHDLERVVDRVYRDGAAQGRLVPMGKVWCGDTPEERERYLTTGVTPRPDGQCHVVEKVRYLDSRSRLLFPCSLLPHRPEAAEVGVPVADYALLSLQSDAIRASANYFLDAGPEICTGCSTSAAGFSNDWGAGLARGEWSY